MVVRGQRIFCEMNSATARRLPSQGQLIFPLLSLAEEAGGKIEPAQAYGALADAHGVARSLQDEIVHLPSGQRTNVWHRHVRFAQLKAKAAGYFTPSARGIWELTDEGQEAVRRAQAAVCVRLFVNEVRQPVAAQIELSVGLPTVHTLHHGDARDLSWIGSGEIPLVVTSIPYFDIKEYGHAPGQLADIASYDDFVSAIGDAMRECYRVMAAGGRMAINVGDVLRSRSRHGTHEVLPLGADVLVQSRKIGFKILTGILWQKIQNKRFEGGKGGVLGQPGMPRMCIPSGSEQILLFKKPGPSLPVTPAQREASRISKEDWNRWVRPVWNDIPGARGYGRHPAPFSPELPRRLITMFSYAGHTVLDPFNGAANTTIGAMRAGRHSVGNELVHEYFTAGVEAVRKEANRLEAATQVTLV